MMWLVGQFNASGHAQPAFIEELESSLQNCLYKGFKSIHEKAGEALF